VYDLFFVYTVTSREFESFKYTFYCHSPIAFAGGSAYGLMFAADGSSVILLAQGWAKETNVLNFVPWVTVYYLHELEESLFPVVFQRALHAAAARMSLCPDHYSPDADESGCDFSNFEP
jgi:hypothetical protein